MLQSLLNQANLELELVIKSLMVIQTSNLRDFLEFM